VNRCQRTSNLNKRGVLENENRNLTSDLSKLKGEYRKLRDNIESAHEGGGSSSNLDLLRRLSKLEKIVYGDND
jgi:hypothetical protein